MNTEGFEFMETEMRHFNGGSWTPECDYSVAIFKCIKCGERIEIEPGGSAEDLSRHKKYCKGK